jgi:hypothetical protein
VLQSQRRARRLVEPENPSRAAELLSIGGACISAETIVVRYTQQSKMSRTGSFVRKIAISLLAIVAAFGGLELALRVRWDRGTWGIHLDTGSALDRGRWVRHPFLPFAGKPYYRDAAANNAYGFRSAEFPTTKSPNDYFVVCIGETGADAADSITPWPELLERRLREKYPDEHIVVFDLGSELATTAMSVVDLSLVGIHVLPDLVVVYHGCDEMAAIGAEDFRADHSHRFMNLKPVKIWHGWAAKIPAWLRSSYLVAYAGGGRDVVRSHDLRDLVVKPKHESGDPFKGFDATLRNLMTVHAVTAGRGGETLFSTYAFKDADDAVRREFNDRLRTFFDANGFRYVDQERLAPRGDSAATAEACKLTGTEQARIAERFAARIEQDDILHLARGAARPSTTIATEFRTSMSEP